MPLALYSLALTVFVMGTSEFMLAGLLPAIADDLAIPVGSAGLLTSAFAIGMVVGAPVMAAFARGRPPRLTLLLCLLAFGACHVLGALTTSFEILLLTRVVSAIANAGFLAVALRTATSLVPPGQTGRAVSVLLAGTTVATVAGVPAGTVLGAAWGWRATFWAVALLCVPALLGIVRGVPARVIAPYRPESTPTPAPAPTPTPTPTPAPTPAPAPAAAPTLRAELRVFGTRPVAIALALAALINGGTFAAFTFLAPIVTETAHLAEGWVAIVLVLFGVGSFVGVTVAGRLSDRHPGLVVGIGGPLLLAGWTAFALLAIHPAALLAGVLVLGVLSFGVGSTLVTRVLYAATAAPTMAGSAATAALNVGAAAGPVLGAAALATGTGPLGPVWVAVALTGIALTLLLLTRASMTRTS
ncbi:MFS transporter [Microbacterium sp. PF5]|uniref:MFS transporter n=1 Tax=Microbacterium sp. PF5 TaxID=2305435 RepID=UPI00109B8BA1|nr:MFS transporter [Microbacterium sp. PF5]